MLAIDIEPQTSGPNRVPQVVVLLDEQAGVLNVNRSLAGRNFESITESEQPLHEQLHPGCKGDCRFSDLWRKAWVSLNSRESIEWELDDPVTGSLLRLNLSVAPSAKNVEQDRRERHRLLTMTDITKYRREYESLVQQQRALVKLLMAPGLGPLEADQVEYDETGDTGNRLMAGFVKEERSFSRQLILAQEKERKRIASELHDGIAQTIGVVKYRIEDSVARFAEQNPDLDVSVFDGAIEDIKGLVEEVRRISSNLAPSMLEDFGLHVALEWLCREFTVQNRDIHAGCEIFVDEGDTPDLVKIAIYRVVQEATNNIAKHAAATRVDVSLTTSEEGVSLAIVDNGKGFDLQGRQGAPDDRTRLGLRSMRERVEATGGKYKMTSIPGKGTTVTAEWSDADLDLIR